MAKKRTDYPAFPNKATMLLWASHNCAKCIKASKPIIKFKMLVGYVNDGRCRINKEILDADVKGGVTRRVSKMIHSGYCPFIKQEWPKRTIKKDNQPELFEDGE